MASLGGRQQAGSYLALALSPLSAPFLGRRNETQNDLRVLAIIPVWRRASSALPHQNLLSANLLRSLPCNANKISILCARVYNSTRS